MSSQRGNVKKNGHQKHQNSYAFKNNLHDTTNKIKILNSLQITGVCQRCKDIIEWKIRYRKYKPLPQAKKCVRCLEKVVKNTYYVMCVACATREGACAKCGEKKHLVLPPELTAEEKAEVDRMLQVEIENLSERQRRAFLRLPHSQQVSQMKIKLQRESDIASGCTDGNVDVGDIERDCPVGNDVTSGWCSDGNVDIGGDCPDGNVDVGEIASGCSESNIGGTDIRSDIADGNIDSYTGSDCDDESGDEELYIKTTDNSNMLS